MYSVLVYSEQRTHTHTTLLYLIEKLLMQLQYGHIEYTRPTKRPNRTFPFNRYTEEEKQCTRILTYVNKWLIMQTKRKFIIFASISHWMVMAVVDYCWWYVFILEFWTFRAKRLQMANKRIISCLVETESNVNTQSNVEW